MSPGLGTTLLSAAGSQRQAATVLGSPCSCLLTPRLQPAVQPARAEPVPLLPFQLCQPRCPPGPRCPQGSCSGRSTRSGRRQQRPWCRTPWRSTGPVAELVYKPHTLISSTVPDYAAAPSEAGVLSTTRAPGSCWGWTQDPESQCPSCRTPAVFASAWWLGNCWPSPFGFGCWVWGGGGREVWEGLTL